MGQKALDLFGVSAAHLKFLLLTAAAG